MSALTPEVQEALNNLFQLLEQINRAIAGGEKGFVSLLSAVHQQGFLDALTTALESLPPRIVADTINKTRLQNARAKSECIRSCFRELQKEVNDLLELQSDASFGQLLTVCKQNLTAQEQKARTAFTDLAGLLKTIALKPVDVKRQINNPAQEVLDSGRIIDHTDELLHIARKCGFEVKAGAKHWIVKKGKHTTEIPTHPTINRYTAKDILKVLAQA